MKKKQKGFALVLSLVLLLAMSLMGGALIVISAGDHQSNNKSDEYQQTFYVAETALLEGEKYVLNQYLGPWNPSNHKRNVGDTYELLKMYPEKVENLWHFADNYRVNFNDICLSVADAILFKTKNPYKLNLKGYSGMILKV